MTQRDQLAMPMYALATIPLINKLKGSSKPTWYADDTAAVGKLAELLVWWDLLTREGPDFGYYPNPSKTWLVTKEGCHAAGHLCWHRGECYLRWQTVPGCCSWLS